LPDTRPLSVRTVRAIFCAIAGDDPAIAQTTVIAIAIRYMFFPDLSYIGLFVGKSLLGN